MSSSPSNGSIDWSAELVTGLGRTKSEQLAREVAARWNTELPALLELVTSSHPALGKKAAWVIRYLSFEAPEVLLPYVPRLITALPHLEYDSAQRDVLKAISVIGYPEEYTGQLADMCMGFLVVPGKAVAVKYLSMQLLEHICEQWPELKREFLMCLQETMPYETKAFQQHARRHLKKAGLAD